MPEPADVAVCETAGANVALPRAALQYVVIGKVYRVEGDISEKVRARGFSGGIPADIG